MFYFLEAVNAPALCRSCVHDQEREITSEPSAPGPSAPPPSDPAPEPGSYADLVPGPRSPRPRMPFHLTEGPSGLEPARSASDAEGALPSGARRLRLAASRYVDQGRLEEAIECIRELASKLAFPESEEELPSFGARRERGIREGSMDTPEVGPASGSSDDSPLAPRRGDPGALPTHGDDPEGIPGLPGQGDPE